MVLLTEEEDRAAAECDVRLSILDVLVPEGEAHLEKQALQLREADHRILRTHLDPLLEIGGREPGVALLDDAEDVIHSDLPATLRVVRVEHLLEKR